MHCFYRGKNLSYLRMSSFYMMLAKLLWINLRILFSMSHFPYQVLWVYFIKSGAQKMGWGFFFKHCQYLYLCLFNTDALSIWPISNSMFKNCVFCQCACILMSCKTFAPSHMGWHLRATHVKNLLKFILIWSFFPHLPVFSTNNWLT